MATPDESFGNPIAGVFLAIIWTAVFAAIIAWAWPPTFWHWTALVVAVALTVEFTAAATRAR